MTAPDESTDTAARIAADVERIARIIHDAECTAYIHEGRNARCEREARRLVEVGVGFVAQERERIAQTIEADWKAGKIIDFADCARIARGDS